LPRPTPSEPSALSALRRSMPDSSQPLIYSKSSASVVRTAAKTNEDALAIDVPWTTFASAGIITSDQMGLIYSLDEKKSNPSLQSGIFKEDGVAYVALFTAFFEGINKDEVIGYALAMLDEITFADTRVASFFTKVIVDSKGATDPLKPLFKLLSRSTPFIVEKAATMMAKLVGDPPPQDCPPAVVAILDGHLSKFAQWVVTAMKEVHPSEAADSEKTSAAISGLQALVSTARGRTAALAADALPPIEALVTASSVSHSSSTVQLLYQTLFALWSLSYSKEAALEMTNSKVGLIAKLVEIIKGSQKEKVIRVALSTLRNLQGVGKSNDMMVVNGLMPVLEVLLVRKFADEDIPEDIDFLHHSLQSNLLGLTSWDVYKTELESGQLEWSPSHKSEHFWKDNHKAFEAHDCAAIKQLVALLSSEDPKVLAIVCSDISELIKHHPEGRRLVVQYGAKTYAMGVLKHPDPTVQKHALTCVQRMMVINWEYLNRS